VFYEKVQPDGLGLTGCCRAMFSNHLSYWLGTNGKLKYGQKTSSCKEFVKLSHAFNLTFSAFCLRMWSI
jgi:fatty acid synthase